MPQFLQFNMTDVILAGVWLFIGAQLATLATTVYLHRALAHRAVKLHPAVEWANRFTLIKFGFSRISMVLAFAALAWAAASLAHERMKQRA